ncbi:hypothetical protein V1280_000843 [Bradyrhizobium sp. AZCC 2230]
MFSGDFVRALGARVEAAKVCLHLAPLAGEVEFAQRKFG